MSQSVKNQDKSLDKQVVASVLPAGGRDDPPIVVFLRARHDLIRPRIFNVGCLNLPFIKMNIEFFNALG